jgi:mono/diheme cytochrome c family protein
LIPAVLAAGCGQSNPFPNLKPVPADVRAEMNKYCALCHGERGDGQGVRTASLSKKPRDWTDMSWQRSITDEEIGRVIVQGGSATGRHNDMPSFAYLKDSPDLAEYINAVRAYAVVPPE